jgi:peptide/nickel transport system substrate-binding protein
LFAAGPEGALFGRRFDLAQFAWMTGVTPPCDLFLTEQIPGDPNTVDENGLARFPYGWGGQNETGYSNLEYDRLCQAALETLPGQPGYQENHHQAQEIFAAELPVVPLYLRLKLAVTRPDMCGFIMDPTALSEMWNIEKFDYGEDCS